MSQAAALSSAMGSTQQFCLKWNNFQMNIVSALESLKTEEDLVDVTLTSGGQSLKAHKVILSACSPYFRQVFKENPCRHPVIILRDVSFDDLEALLTFVYHGQVHISQEQLSSFLRTAEALQIKGLTDAGRSRGTHNEQTYPSAPAAVPTPDSDLVPIPAPAATIPVPACTPFSASPPVLPTTLQQKRRKGAPPKRTHALAQSLSPSSKTDEEDVLLVTEDEESVAAVSQTAEDEAMNLATAKLEPPDVHDEESNEMEDEQQPFHQTVQEELLSGGEESKGEGSCSGASLSFLASLASAPIPVGPSSTLAAALQEGRCLPPHITGCGTSSGMNLDPIPDRFSSRPCPYCLKIISNQSNLQKHMKIRHSNVFKREACRLCGKEFKNKYSLGAHLYTYHRLRNKNEGLSGNVTSTAPYANSGNGEHPKPDANEAAMLYALSRQMPLGI